MSKRPLALASRVRLFFWMFFLACATAQAAEFDERIKAPRAANAADLKRSVQEYFAAYERKKDDVEDSAELIKNPATYARWFDTQWRLTRGLDEGMDLGDLAELGLEREEDGSYTVHAKTHPQWMPVDLPLMTLRNSSAFDRYARDLKQRGFRDQDVAVLKNYVDSNNWERSAFAENKPLTETFAAKAQALHRAKRAVGPEETMAYVYQRSRNSMEARRAWAAGLLDTLDKQRQRILLSYIQEFDATSTFGPGERQLSRRLESMVAPLISGEYVQALKQEELKVRQ